MSSMTNRERAMAVLNYESYDRLPLVHFGYWGETLQKWVDEGHLTPDDIQGVGDGNDADNALAAKLGFDFNWNCVSGAHTWLNPGIESKVIEEFPDGSQHVLYGDGVVYLQKPGAGSIPAHVDYLLKNREVWEAEFKHRLQWSDDRLNKDAFEWLKTASRENVRGIHCGSLYGNIRTMLTFEGACYLQADDEELYTEIIDAVGELTYQGVKSVLELGIEFDFVHFWEDICFKNGPCVSPRTFHEKVGPHYKRITDLTRQHGIEICSLDCDGMIDALIPTWIENGVNVMFPIEVGTWDANIIPWREKYGKELRGVGGMNKNVFGRDRAAIDDEIERLRPQIELGGFIPCPDHRIAPDAKWDMVRYYCDRMHEEFA